MTAAPPPCAAAVFGDRIVLAERFAAWLTGPGIIRGLLGPREADQIWERHLLDGVGMAALIEAGAKIVDLGAGAGLPGLPLLLARPDLQMVLVEPKARRVAFLDEVCADLDLPARVVRARATPAGLVLLPEGTVGDVLPPADVVTARAVAAIGELGRWAAPLLRPGGWLLAVKGSSAAAELRRDRPVLTELGFVEAQIWQVGTCQNTIVHRPRASEDGHQPATTTVVSMRWNPVSRET